MTYGLEILSADGGLAVISDKSSNLIYIGKAGYVSSFGAGRLADRFANLRNYWQLTYRIVSEERPTAYVSSILGISVGVEGIWQSSQNTWTITVGVSGYQFSFPYLPTVYCFSKIPKNIVPSGYGLAVYREDGSVAFDSSNGYKYLQITNIFTANIPQGCSPVGNGGICTESVASVVPAVVPQSFASSFAVNAKRIQHADYEFGQGGYHLALGAYVGNNAFNVGWYFLTNADYRVGTALIDATPRITTFIDCSMYDS